MLSDNESDSDDEADADFIDDSALHTPEFTDGHPTAFIPVAALPAATNNAGERWAASSHDAPDGIRAPPDDYINQTEYQEICTDIAALPAIANTAGEMWATSSDEPREGLPAPPDEFID
jgi:hypothetical protein